MQSYWSSFAIDGDPNTMGQLMWPKYSEASDQHLRLVDPPTVASGLQRAACDYWDKYLMAQ